MWAAVITLWLALWVPGVQTSAVVPSITEEAPGWGVALSNQESNG
jgi:hypothetical protein